MFDIWLSWTNTTLNFQQEMLSLYILHVAPRLFILGDLIQTPTGTLRIRTTSINLNLQPYHWWFEITTWTLNCKTFALYSNPQIKNIILHLTRHTWGKTLGWTRSSYFSKEHVVFAWWTYYTVFKSLEAMPEWTGSQIFRLWMPARPCCKSQDPTVRRIYVPYHQVNRTIGRRASI